MPKEIPEGIPERKLFLTRGEISAMVDLKEYINIAFALQRDIKKKQGER